ncbi:glycine-rich protein 5-like [Impatiens glandulifera]|uniref:glycine-rich protein 5-like n=1 Tax=Impatiens glandulifera TaxID=253017 RepID=UPI001FB0A42D|nr:glycine-rich protein 5-like [Impatiens glandulifera]
MTNNQKKLVFLSFVFAVILVSITRAEETSKYQTKVQEPKESSVDQLGFNEESGVVGSDQVNMNKGGAYKEDKHIVDHHHHHHDGYLKGDDWDWYVHDPVQGGMYWGGRRGGGSWGYSGGRGSGGGGGSWEYGGGRGSGRWRFGGRGGSGEGGWGYGGGRGSGGGGGGGSWEYGGGRGGGRWRFGGGVGNGGGWGYGGGGSGGWGGPNGERSP